MRGRVESGRPTDLIKVLEVVNRRTVQPKIDLSKYISVCYRGKLCIDPVSDRIPLPMMYSQALDLIRSWIHSMMKQMQLVIIL